MAESGSGAGQAAPRSAAWAVAAAPLPADAVDNGTTAINGVSCVSPSFCVAVGEYVDSSRNGQSLLLTRSGGTWLLVTAPLPPDANSDPDAALSAVSCVSASFCVAAGSYTDVAGTGQGLLLIWSGGSWSATKAPLPGGTASDPQAGLESVSCVSVSFCVATGGYTDSSGDGQGLLLTWSGSAWSAAVAPLPGGAVSDNDAAEVPSVSCVSVSFCAASSQYWDTTSGEDRQDLLLTRSGGTWSATVVPFLAGTASGPDDWAEVDGVSCVSDSFCAAGGFEESSGRSYNLLVTRSGGSWSVSEAPLPADVTTDPEGVLSVSCVSASFCVAGGQYGYQASDGQGLLLTRSGGTWSATTAPLPADAESDPDAMVNSVSCVSASFCVAGGQYGQSSDSDDDQGLLLTWSRT